MKKLLNCVVLLSLFSFITMMIFVFASKIYLLKLFPYILLSFLCLLSFGVVRIFLFKNQLPKLAQTGIIILCILPVLVPIFGLVNSNQVESNWPLIVGGVVFQVGIGLLSLLGLFLKDPKPHYFTRWMLYGVALLSAVWFVVVLLKLSKEEVYVYSPVLGILLTLFYVAALINDLIQSKTKG